MLNLVVVCADIGSIAKGRFAWWSSLKQSGNTASTLATHVALALSDGKKVALGFECPLFVPLETNENELTRSRPGEGNRAWSAGAGCGALATGLVQVAWVLQEIRTQLRHEVQAYMSWEDFKITPSGLLIWEAFVSGDAKRSDHHQDAKAGAEAFLGSLPTPQSAVVCESPVYSLAGAALLRTNWSTDPLLLKQACLVIRAQAKPDHT